MTPTNATQSDAALAAAAREDAAAFDALYRRYVTRVYRYCYSRTNNAQVAEDLTAQTFLAALEGIGRFRGDGSVAAWLFGIAANVCKGYYRYQKRHPQGLRRRTVGQRAVPSGASGRWQRAGRDRERDPAARRPAAPAGAVGAALGGWRIITHSDEL